MPNTHKLMESIAENFSNFDTEKTEYLITIDLQYARSQLFLHCDVE